MIYISNKETFLPRFSTDSEAFASDLLENAEEMFSRYYMHVQILYHIPAFYPLQKDDSFRSIDSKRNALA